MKLYIHNGPQALGVACEGHARRPTDIYRWEPMTLREIEEWSAYIRETYGPDADPCDWCRETSVPKAVLV